MKAVIVHHSFNTLGGAELYAFDVIRVLASLGFDIKVYTLGTKGLIDRSILLDRVKLVETRPLLKTGGIYDFILNTYYLFRVLKLEASTDATINTKANEVPLEADVCIVHYPLGFALYYWNRVLLGAGVDPKYVNSLFWKLYVQPFRKWFYRLSNKGLRRCRAIVVNSKWTANFLEELNGLRSVVIYPSVDLTRFKPSIGVAKEDIVVTVSRFDPSKNLKAILYVAKRIPHAKFVVIGRISDRASYAYYRHVKKLRERLKLSNIYLLPNLSEDAKKSILLKAKIYFHPTIGEHFGISVLEALASGAIPIVSKFSGSCIDIVESIGYGYCYNSYAEASEIIESLLSKREIEAPSAEELSKVLSTFSFEEFSRRFTKIINEVTGGRALN